MIGVERPPKLEIDLLFASSFCFEISMVQFFRFTKRRTTYGSTCVFVMCVRVRKAQKLDFIQVREMDALFSKVEHFCFSEIAFTL